MLHLLITCKVYLDRARMYYGYAQMFALLSLMLNAMHVPLRPLYFVVGVPLFLALSVLIGWVDKRLGLMEAEAHKLSNLNPTYNEIIDRLDRIEKKPGYTIVAHSMMPKDKVIMFTMPIETPHLHIDPVDAANKAFKEWLKNSPRP